MPSTFSLSSSPSSVTGLHDRRTRETNQAGENLSQPRPLLRHYWAVLDGQAGLANQALESVSAASLLVVLERVGSVMLSINERWAAQRHVSGETGRKTETRIRQSGERLARVQDNIQGSGASPVLVDFYADHLEGASSFLCVTERRSSRPIVVYCARWVHTEYTSHPCLWTDFYT